ncbi:AEC family transporter [Actinotignum urinale]|uniref:AEC family transporter n=1 Tax=Actinotignum urinale TaxID=190146 RepID=UPI002A7FB600|nr:AEC family transporter [Actinotignum urinale]MDY5151720.1 AEC family transporter [Actinotignum urinale]
MSTILLNFWGIIAIILVGYILARTNVVPKGTDRVLTQLAFASTLPALIFVMVSHGDPAAVFSAVGTTNIISAVGVALLYALIGRYLLNIRGTELTVGMLTACYTNIGNLGIAFLVAITGDATAAAPILLFQIVVLLPFFFAVLDWQTGRNSGGIMKALARMMTNPLLIAVLTGLVVSIVKIPIPAVIESPLDMMGKANVPIILLAMGISLRGSHIPKWGHDAAALLLGIVMRCIGGPLLVWLFAMPMGVTGKELMSLMIVGAFPTANNVFVFAHRYHANVGLARDAVIITTFVSLTVILGIALVFHTA